MTRTIVNNTRRPDDIPERIWDLAAEQMRRTGWRAPSMIEGAARAVLEYRRLTDISRYSCAIDASKRTIAAVKEIPQDIWDAAFHWIDDSGFISAFYSNHDEEVLRLTIARAILSERERCATNIERRDGAIPDRSGIAREIRLGIVVDEHGVTRFPRHLTSPTKQPHG